MPGILWPWCSKWNSSSVKGLDASRVGAPNSIESGHPPPPSFGFEIALYVVDGHSGDGPGNSLPFETEGGIPAQARWAVLQASWILVVSQSRSLFRRISSHLVGPV